jgi:hypothetical protein
VTRGKTSVPSEISIFSDLSANCGDFDEALMRPANCSRFREMRTTCYATFVLW